MGRPRKPEGMRVVEQLNKLLDAPAEWDEREQLVLESIRRASDRGALLADLLTVEAAKEPVSTRRITELAAEIRQCEANVLRWSDTLNPDATVPEPKSLPHQNAANRRWHG
ncbi:hypothetical protein [Rhodococcus wratislaviensis]|uniref:Uncharacterized protein n=1 Tax=Rhodococcus wratislaviensis NBRC 100605 TaxID=1219028 RepID=X0Q7F9_RHOWR|nr:hypothetical protein [Rhodococcus wratislaviensis]GAF47377.1 hypothetical protein RW1_040_00390 [Rhodococcus wratislaviensis NBRC 100605]